MELIMISSTKLKIMLSAEDMKKLDFDPGGCADISGRAGFRSILREAKERCGFDALGDRLFVQYYPEKHGGCEMFVTKLEDDKKTDIKGKKKRQTTNALSANTDKYYARYIIYAFKEMKDLLSTCRCLENAGYDSESLVYKIPEKHCKYCLVLEKDSFFAMENNGIRFPETYLYFLREHGQLMCKNAVSKLGKLS